MNPQHNAGDRTRDMVSVQKKSIGLSQPASQPEPDRTLIPYIRKIY